MKEYDVAILVRDIPEQGLRKGDRVVLMDLVNADKTIWLVERPNDELPHGVTDVYEKDLELVWREGEPLPNDIGDSTVPHG